MPKKDFRHFTFALILLSTSYFARSANFPGQITGSEIENINQQLAGTLQHKPWTHSGVRPAAADFSLGVESSLSFNTNVNAYGDKSGRAPSTTALPKLYGSAAFRPDIHVSASYFPGESFAGVTTYGLSGEWFFYRNPREISAAVLLHYSHSRVFGDYKANTQGLQFAANHEFKAFIFYAALGILSVESRVRAELLAPGTADKAYGSLNPHVIVGAKVDADFPISLQTETIGRNISLGLLIAKDF